MKKQRMKAAVMAGVLLCSALAGTHVHASQEEIDAVSAYKAATEANLSATQSHIDSLAVKQQEMQNYLYELNSQYEELTKEIENLSLEAGQKQELLKSIQANLENAKAAASKQYDGMKTRMAYLFENGSTSVLAMLLSSDNMADFLNRAENIRQISDYDQRQLTQYKKLQEEIKTQESKEQEEIESINTLMQEKAFKQQEVETLAANTNESIASYAYQISASQAEANALIAEIQSADAELSSLRIQQAAAEAAAAEAAQRAYEEQQAAAAQEQADSEESYDSEEDYNSEESYDDQESYTEDFYTEDSQESYTEEVSEPTYEEPVQEETYAEETPAETYEEPAASSSSSQGTYLGTFTLTAYCNCASCCGTAGNLTASGTWPTAGRTVAMGGVPFGTQLLINGTVYTVEDRGTAYGHVDVYMDSHSAALQFGMQSAEVYQLN